MASRFRYVDSNGNDQIIASTGGNGGQPLDRIKETRRNKDTHIIVAWSNRSLFGEFPTDRTQFQADEPEIFFEQFRDGSWEIQNRVYAKDSGTTTTGGNYKIKLYGFQKYGEEQQVNITNTTTHTVDVAEKLAAELDSNYVIDAPAEANVPGGYPQVDSYSLNGRAGKVVREITRDFKSDGNDWTINWTGQTDANGNYIIRYEPEGFGGAVDTLDDSIVGLQVQNWKKERTDQIINKTKVVGTLDDGTDVTGTAENTTMINRYGVKFRSYQVGYLGSSAEADRIAGNKLQPGLDANGNDITESPESGTLKVPTLNYREGVENDSFNVVLPEIDVDDTFTCVTQKLYYPANNTELVFEFEKEGLEDQAEGRNALNEERAKIYSSGDQSIDINFGDFNAENDTAEADNSTTEDDEDPGVGGNTGQSGPNTFIDDADDTTTLSGGIGTGFEQVASHSANVGSNGAAGVVIYITVGAAQSSGSSSSYIFDVGVTQNGSEIATINQTYPNFSIYDDGQNVSGGTTLWVPALIDDNDTIDVNIRTTGGTTGPVFVDTQMIFIEKHSHPGLTDGGTLAAALHDHNVFVQDSGHGGSGDASEHVISGDTVQKLINLLQELKTDR